MANPESAVPPLSANEVLEILFGGRTGAPQREPKATGLQPAPGCRTPTAVLAEAEHGTGGNHLRLIWHLVTRALV
jgi:hypothetical protein